MMDFDLTSAVEDSQNHGESSSINLSTKSAGNNGSRKGSPTPPNKPPKPSFHLTRRLSSNFPLVKSAESRLPLPDAVSIAKFDSLIDQFPKPPASVEPSKTKEQKASAAVSASTSSWGSLKGLAERFNLFSKA